MMGRNSRDEFMKTEFEALNPRVPGILDDLVYNKPPSNPVPKARPKTKKAKQAERLKQFSVFEFEEDGDLPPEGK